MRDICQRRYQPCPCTYDPSKVAPPSRISDKPLIDQRARERLVFPNGYCRNGGRLDHSMSCYFRSKKCSRGQDTCESAYDPCICDFDPDNQPALLASTYPNGECRFVRRGITTPRTLWCTFRFRTCSKNHGICRMQLEQCTCDYDPFLSGSMSVGLRGRPRIDELPALSQRKGDTKEKQHKGYRPRVKFPPGQSLAQQRLSSRNEIQRRSYPQGANGNALSIRSVLQPVCMVNSIHDTHVCAYFLDLLTGLLKADCTWPLPSRRIPFISP